MYIVITRNSYCPVSLIFPLCVLVLTNLRNMLTVNTYREQIHRANGFELRRRPVASSKIQFSISIPYKHAGFLVLHFEFVNILFGLCIA